MLYEVLEISDCVYLIFVVPSLIRRYQL